MTITNESLKGAKGSKIRSFSQAPVVVAGSEGLVEPIVALKLLVSGNGYNAGEIARFPQSVAAAMVERKQAMPAVSQPSQAKFGSKVTRALTLIGRALDKKEALAVQFEQLRAAITDAEQAVDEAREAQEGHAASYTDARIVLEAANKAVLRTDGEALDAVQKEIADAQKLYEKATGAVKRAKNKDAANAAVAAAEGAVSVATVKAGNLQTAYETSARLRVKDIEAAVAAEEAALGQDTSVGMGQLEAEFAKLER